MLRVWAEQFQAAGREGPGSQWPWDGEKALGWGRGWEARMRLAVHPVPSVDKHHQNLDFYFCGIKNDVT